MFSGFYGDFGGYSNAPDVHFSNINGHRIKSTIDCNGIFVFCRYVCAFRNSYRPTNHQTIRPPDVSTYDQRTITPLNHHTIKPSMSLNTPDHHPDRPSGFFLLVFLIRVTQCCWAGGLPRLRTTLSPQLAKPPSYLSLICCSL